MSRRGSRPCGPRRVVGARLAIFASRRRSGFVAIARLRAQRVSASDDGVGRPCDSGHHSGKRLRVLMAATASVPKSSRAAGMSTAFTCGRARQEAAAPRSRDRCCPALARSGELLQRPRTFLVTRQSVRPRDSGHRAIAQVRRSRGEVGGSATDSSCGLRRKLDALREPLIWVGVAQWGHDDADKQCRFTPRRHVRESTGNRARGRNVSPPCAASAHAVVPPSGPTRTSRRESTRGIRRYCGPAGGTCLASPGPLRRVIESSALCCVRP